jgi:hypothetical protein
MLIREIDHALTTIHCTLDGMEAVIQMIMEVQTIDADAVGISADWMHIINQTGKQSYRRNNEKIINT